MTTTAKLSTAHGFSIGTPLLLVNSWSRYCFRVLEMKEGINFDWGWLRLEGSSCWVEVGGWENMTTEVVFGTRLCDQLGSSDRIYKNHTIAQKGGSLN